MSTVAVSGPVTSSGKRRTPHFTAKLFGSAAILAAAVAFVFKYAFRYHLLYDEATLTAPPNGAPTFWVMRGWLLMHMSGGMVALLTGPWQFWTGFRMRYVRLHRWTGRIFLCAVAVGCIGPARMISVTTYGWPDGFGLAGLATAWATTAGMAYYAILNRRIQVHKEWMVRAYIVTFAFVTFRVLSGYYPGAPLQPDLDRINSFLWACWAIPLLVAEVILQLRHMRSVGMPG